MEKSPKTPNASQSELKPSESTFTTPVSEAGLYALYNKAQSNYNNIAIQTRHYHNRVMERGFAAWTKQILAEDPPLVDLMMLFEYEHQMWSEAHSSTPKLGSIKRKLPLDGTKSTPPSAGRVSKAGNRNSSKKKKKMIRNSSMLIRMI